MKRILFVICGILIVFVISGTAIASTIWYGIEYNPRDDFLRAYVDGDESISWWVDIVPKGFNPDVQDVVDAWLWLDLRGDHDDYDETGQVKISTDYELEATLDNPNRNQWVHIDDNLSWLQDGNTLITVEATLGDFYFERARFYAEATAPVPEPATLLLFGTGLIGLAGFGRRKLVKK